jgi:hypothetical protein
MYSNGVEANRGRIDMRKTRKAVFHMGIDYACVILDGQTTDAATVRLYGTSEEVEFYGKLVESAINVEASAQKLRPT